MPIKTILSVLIFFCSFSTLLATEKPKGERYFGLSPQVTSLSVMRTGTTFGLGVNGLFSARGEKQAYFVDLNYYFPCHSQRKEVLYYTGTMPDQFQKKINVDYKISARSALVGYRLYFLKNMADDGFKIYMQAIAGVQYLNVSSTAESYDKKEYDPQYEAAYTATALTLGGGLGGEYSLGKKLNIFGDINLNLPVLNVGAIKVDVEIPITMKLALGTKFLF